MAHNYFKKNIVAFPWHHMFFYFRINNRIKSIPYFLMKQKNLPICLICIESDYFVGFIFDSDKQSSPFPIGKGSNGLQPIHFKAVSFVILSLG